jgi:hypothetical protein
VEIWLDLEQQSGSPLLQGPLCMREGTGEYQCEVHAAIDICCCLIDRPGRNRAEGESGGERRGGQFISLRVAVP